MPLNSVILDSVVRKHCHPSSSNTNICHALSRLMQMGKVPFSVCTPKAFSARQPFFKTDATWLHLFTITPWLRLGKHLRLTNLGFCLRFLGFVLNPSLLGGHPEGDPLLHLDLYPSWNFAGSTTLLE